MIKIIEKNIKGENLEARDIPCSTVFYAHINEENQTSLFLKTFSQVVDLNNPRKTWSDGSTKFHNYKPVDIEIIVK